MNYNKLPKGIRYFSFIEITLGIITMSGLTLSLVFNFNTKPMNILLFVYITSLLSLFLGFGLLLLNKQAYELLIFLVSVVLLSKILIFTGIIELNGALETKIPSNIKNIISMAYHSAMLIYLNLPNTKKLFLKK
jgi:hypothetical protein